MAEVDGEGFSPISDKLELERLDSPVVFPLWLQQARADQQLRYGAAGTLLLW